MAFYIIVVSPYLLSEEGFAGSAMPLLIVVFVASLALSFLIYRMIVKIVFTKCNMEKYFSEKKE
jgi:hypothetical protein